MSRLGWLALGLCAGIAGTSAAIVGVALHGGIGARGEPSSAEALLARRIRHLAIPRAARARANPVPASAAVIAAGRTHWADHCASCHGNDGRGDTPLGRGLYPRAPNMQLEATQGLADGELFYIIENGVRLTGMPAWGGATDESASETWHLVHFIRHLPEITPEEAAAMEALNPKTAAQLADEEETRRFLEDDSGSNESDRTNGDAPPSNEASREKPEPGR
ncbi:MAG: cytochrome c [bacterium]